MRLTTKQILALGLIAGAVGVVLFCYNHARQGSPPPHLVFIVSEKRQRFDGGCLRGSGNISHYGASIILSNAGPEEIWLKLGTPESYFAPSKLLEQQFAEIGRLAKGQRVDFSDRIMPLGYELRFHIQVTVRGSRIQRASRSAVAASKTFLETAKPTDAWKKFKSEMEYRFFGPTYDFVKTITFDPLAESTALSE